MSKGLEALNNHKLVLKALGHKNCEEWENLKDIEKELKALAILIYWYQPNIIHDLFCLGASDEEINLVREVLKE